ncbi:MAG TPA: NAD+ synthase [Verrucomicrobiota bacterium]|nr:NAD+ synthase [Verrucomicrobiota bacterium]HNT13996.1 NAD+ synthase [Verrucomicrobiota bacterium]
MKIGVLQLNATVGDFTGNHRRLLAGYEEAVARGAEFVVSPELYLCGSAPRDLLGRPDFIAAGLATLDATAQAIGPVPLCVGSVTRDTDAGGPALANTAAVLQNGKIIWRQSKTMPPNHHVLDALPCFTPTRQVRPFEFKGRKIGITIGDDISGSAADAERPSASPTPVRDLTAQGAGLILNLTALPWRVGKEKTRLAMLQRVARNAGAPLVQVNAVGGSDELIFDGHSMALNQRGEVLALGKGFSEDHLVVEVDASASTSEPHWPGVEEQLFHALSLGIRDYVHKCGFKSVLIGLSGGIDSALVAVLAVNALGADHVLGVSMPARHSSRGSLTDAAALANNLGIRHEVISIENSVAAVEAQLAKWFAGTKPNEAEENIQARLRGVTLMALANKFGGMVLNTGNKSEAAVGYCTLYGDTCGALGVLADVYKTEVYAISRWVNRDREVIPAATLSKPPSAELRPNQKDQDSLPAYEVLDALLRSYVEEHLSVKEIIARGFSPALVEEITRKVAQSEYKRRQAPPGLQVSPRAFGSEWRMPIAQRFQGPA